ncbi:hypothetical protein FPV67DRAFT_1449655 [Lyophyllum atratum]|nr:hypothetical protein FPV67DRAFT_1449655 [Lyophyllum atratum]
MADHKGLASLPQGQSEPVDACVGIEPSSFEAIASGRCKREGMRKSEVGAHHHDGQKQGTIWDGTASLQRRISHASDTNERTSNSNLRASYIDHDVDGHSLDSSPHF